MSAAAARDLLSTAYAGRVATVDADGWPYICPLLFVCIDEEVWVHTGAALEGHLRRNVEGQAQVCFEVDEAGEVFPYGRFECDTAIAYRSVVVFGRIRIVSETPRKQAFFDAFMRKYGRGDAGRPKSFYPRLDQVTVYAIAVERMTGKETLLPAIEERWPAVDRTKTPHAKA